PFNPERDITQKDWENMKLGLGHMWNSGKIDDYARQAANMLMLFPEKREEINLQTRDANDLMNHLGPTTMGPVIPIENLAFTKLIYPHDFDILWRRPAIRTIQRDIALLLSSSPSNVSLDWNRLNDKIFSTFVLLPDKF